MYEKLDIKYNIFSEAFPPDEKGERHNLLSYSSYHNLINGIKINPEKIIYKPLSNSNFLEVKNLHKEWFPIDYDDNFFNQVLNNNGGKYFTVGAFYNINNENINKEIILGLAFCEFEYVMERLNQNIGEKILDEINGDLKLCDEIKSYLKCQFDKCIYVMTIGVMDEFRQMNIGSNLLKYIYKIALEIDRCIGVYLHVICYNEIAIKFYQKNKFKKVGKIDKYYYFNNKNYDAYVFLRTISKKEREEYKKSAGNVIQENKFTVNNVYKNIYFIKTIILIVLNIISYLIESREKQKS